MRFIKGIPVAMEFVVAGQIIEAARQRQGGFASYDKSVSARGEFRT
ncbi:MAG: hypothetical protein J0I08_22570 [Rhizobiales bacterium]|nr:hypothetical protein [Hyphomicrobiales bacterium]